MTSLFDTLAPYRKSILAGLIAFLSTLLTLVPRTR